MMQPSPVRALGRARLAELHRQAQRAALARAAHCVRDGTYSHAALSQASRRLSRLAAVLTAAAASPRRG